MKTGSTWRQLVKLDNIDGCFFLNSIQNQNLPLIDAVRVFYTTHMPNLPRKCPIPPGNYTAYNVTAIDHRNNGTEGGKLLTKMSPVPFPNGVYRHFFQLTLDSDKNAVTFYFHSKIDQSMNANEF